MPFDPSQHFIYNPNLISIFKSYTKQKKMHSSKMIYEARLIFRSMHTYSLEVLAKHEAF